MLSLKLVFGISVALAIDVSDRLRRHHEAAYKTKNTAGQGLEQKKLKRKLGIDVNGETVILEAEEPELLPAARQFVITHLDGMQGANCAAGDVDCLTRAVHQALVEKSEVEECGTTKNWPWWTLLLVPFPLLYLGRKKKAHRLSVDPAEEEEPLKCEQSQAVDEPAEPPALERNDVALATNSSESKEGELSASTSSMSLKEKEAEKTALENLENVIAQLRRQNDKLRAELERVPQTQHQQAPADVAQLLEQNEMLKLQLRKAGVKAIEEVVSYEEAKEKLVAATRALLSGDGDEGELEKWDEFIACHPKHIAEQKAKYESWLEENAPINEKCRTVVKGFVPSGALNGIKRDDVPQVAAKRVLSTPALWLVVGDTERIARIHLADLRGRYQTSGLTMLELRAVYANLPTEFVSDSSGEKRAWRDAIETKLRGASAANIPKHKLAHSCYPEVAVRWAFSPTETKDAPADVLAVLPLLGGNFVAASRKEEALSDENTAPAGEIAAKPPCAPSFKKGEEKPRHPLADLNRKPPRHPLADLNRKPPRHPLADLNRKPTHPLLAGCKKSGESGAGAIKPKLDLADLIKNHPIQKRKKQDN